MSSLPFDEDELEALALKSAKPNPPRDKDDTICAWCGNKLTAPHHNYICTPEKGEAIARTYEEEVRERESDFLKERFKPGIFSVIKFRS